MKTLTVRLDDRTYDELSRLAQARGESLSDLARGALEPLLRRETGGGGRRPGEAPTSLTALERRQLSLLHRILARLVADDPNTDDGDPAYQLKRAEVLERGYVVEYADEFLSIEPELSRRESAFVMDVLDMFTRLEHSYSQLSAADRKSLGEHAQFRLQFRGFDLNDRLEGRLYSYARHLIDEGKWQMMAKYFTDAHDRGNSHGPTFDTYSRMLEEFLPIWKSKVQEMRPDGYDLSVEEIRRVVDAAVHPDNRR